MLTFEKYEESGWFVVSPFNMNLGKTFLSKKEAQDFLRPLKKFPPFDKARIVEGSIDSRGFVTPY